MNSYNRAVAAGEGSFLQRTPRATSAPRSRVRSAGPGDYDYKHLYETGSDASIRMRSAFQSDLPLGGHVRKSTTPGVGTYETTAGPMGKSMNRMSRSFSNEGMSMFASKVPATKNLADSTRTSENVAPGSYDLSRQSIGGELARSKNPRLPGFRSSAPRFDADYYDD